jgi:hypothetical protein
MGNTAYETTKTGKKMDKMACKMGKMSLK